MNRSEGYQPRDIWKSLGVWLALVGLLIGTLVVFRVESDHPLPLDLAVKTSPVKPANVKDPPPAIVQRSPADPAKSPSIRINVTPGGATTFQLEIRGPYTLRQVGSTLELGKGNGLAASTVQATATGLKIGRSVYKCSQLEIDAGQDPAVRVNQHLYRGSMRLYRRKDGQISAVNVLPLEEYLASVVDSEMPAAFPENARQAQAIVSRTYALYQMEHADPAAVYDVFSSQRSQKYLGTEYVEGGRRLAGESASSRSAVASTRGVICTVRGRLFCTYYSAVCGGQTTNGLEVFPDAAAVVKSVPCEWCRDSQYFRWTAELDRSELLKQLQPAGSLSKVTSIVQTTGPGKGAISRFQFGDGHKTASVTGVQLRERLPATTLRSPHFTLSLEKDKVRVEGRGHGHGVGFCQWGARGQASAGKTAHDIVRHYYPGAELTVRDY